MAGGGGDIRRIGAIGCQGARLAGIVTSEASLSRHSARLPGNGRSGLVPGVHAPATTRWRIGRQARSIVWVRSGPTETSTIGAPAASSRAVT